MLNVLDLALVLTALYWWSKALEILGAGITSVFFFAHLSRGHCSTGSSCASGST
ncbi:MAG: hypothetical protein ABI874_05205 [Chloroflexota bacterium]